MLQPLSCPRVVALVGGASGCSLWRVWQPMAQLERFGFPVGWEFVGDAPNEEREQLRLTAVSEQFVQRTLARVANGEADALILPRMGWPSEQRPQMYQFLQALKRAGNVLIYEADDDIFSPSIVGQQHRGLQRERSEQELEEERQMRLETLRLCDGITVSTQRLATVVRQYVPEGFPIEVVPNLIDWGWWQRIRAVAERWIPGPTIGWAGGGRPDEDMTELAWAWGQVAQRHADVRFVVQGCRPGPDGKPSIEATPWLRPVLEQLPPERLIALPWFSVKEYPLGMLNMDIGCCPLADRPFNRCKTPIKAMEFAAAGAAVIASPVVYSQLIEGGWTGLLATTREAWVEGLLQLLEEEAYRQRLARNLAARVQSECSLQQEWWRWPLAWNSVLQQAKLRSSLRKPGRIGVA